MFKKIFFTVLGCLSIWSSSHALERLSQDDIVPRRASTIIDTWQWNGTWIILQILQYLRDSLFTVLAISATLGFIYVWFLFVSSRGKPEWFKKASTHAVYIIIGLALMTLSYAIVNIIVWFTL